jgi:recombination protein RecT
MADTSNTQLVQMNTMKQLLNADATKKAIAGRLPRHLDADRILKVALTSINKTPKLMQCTQASIFASIMQAAEIGLEPGGALGEGYLVPFNVKVKDERGQDHWEMQCQFIPGYRGMIALARRSGQIISLESHIVYAKDSFKCALGLEPSLDHTPAWEELDPGPMRFVYAVAKLKDGGTQFEVMSRAQVEGIRARSKAKDSGPWVTDYDEMARKTVVRRLFKYLPVSVEMAQALEAQAAAEIGDFGLTPGTIDLQISDGQPDESEVLMDKLNWPADKRKATRESYADRPLELVEYLRKQAAPLQSNGVKQGTQDAKPETQPQESQDAGKNPEPAATSGRGGGRKKKSDEAPKDQTPEASKPTDDVSAPQPDPQQTTQESKPGPKDLPATGRFAGF